MDTLNQNFFFSRFFSRSFDLGSKVGNIITFSGTYSRTFITPDKAQFMVLVCGLIVDRSPGL